MLLIRSPSRNQRDPDFSVRVFASEHQFVRLQRGSTIGEGGDTTILPPERSPKQPLLGIGLYDRLHDWQACPEFIAFHQGDGKICSR